MKRKTLVQPQPIAEQVVGVVTEIGDQTLLSSAELAEGRAIARGDLTLRYGITYLGKPQFSIVPRLVVADYGELLNGEAAWDFLMTKAHLYPRADVCGFRSDGIEDMPALKQLDFEYPYAVFVYRQVQDDLPLARLAALIDDGFGAVPERLRRHLPQFDNLHAWRRNE
ncbi:MAG: hypothetical protein OXN88_09215 [Chloroflexota bacterium]|nr:hypothetical protein [Chloroflexota bacterium]